MIKLSGVNGLAVHTRRRGILLDDAQDRLLELLMPTFLSGA